jgi:anti-anti-sigma factor
MAFSITSRTEGDAFIYILDGALDTDAAEEVGSLARQSFLSGATKLIFDLEKVPYVASRGLGLFVTAIQSFPGKVVFAALQPYVRQTFQLAAFNKIDTICKTVDEALKV